MAEAEPMVRRTSEAREDLSMLASSSFTDQLWLPTEIWQMVFCYVHPKEYVSISNVNVTWRDLSRPIFLKQLKRLPCSPKVSPHELVQLLQLFGPDMEFLEIHRNYTYTETYTRFIMIQVYKYCRKLTNLVVSSRMVEHHGLSTGIPLPQSLTYLEISYNEKEGYGRDNGPYADLEEERPRVEIEEGQRAAEQKMIDDCVLEEFEDVEPPLLTDLALTKTAYEDVGPGSSVFRGEMVIESIRVFRNIRRVSVSLTMWSVYHIRGSDPPCTWDSDMLDFLGRLLSKLPALQSCHIKQICPVREQRLPQGVGERSYELKREAILGKFERSRPGVAFTFERVQYYFHSPKRIKKLKEKHGINFRFCFPMTWIYDKPPQ